MRRNSPSGLRAPRAGSGFHRADSVPGAARPHPRAYALWAAVLAAALLAWGGATWAGKIVVLDDQKGTSQKSTSTDRDSEKEDRVDVDISVDEDWNETDPDSMEESEEGRWSRRDLARRRGGKSTDDMVSFGKDLVVESDQVVHGDVVCMMGSVRVEGLVHGSVVAIGGEIRLGDEAVIYGDAVSLGGGGVEVQPGSVITGQAVAIGGRIDEVPGAHIGDRVELKFIPAFGRPGFMGFRGWILLFILCLHLLFIGLIGLILARLAPRRWAASVATLKARGWESLLAGIGAGMVFGIVGLPLMLVIIIALVALVVGIPLVPLVAFLLLIFPVPGYLITSLLLGGALRGMPVAPDEPATTGQGGAYLLGHVLLSSPWLLMIPVSAVPGLSRLYLLLLLLGWGVISLAVAFGWGAFLLSRFGNRFPRALLPPAPAQNQEAAPVS